MKKRVIFLIIVMLLIVAFAGKALAADQAFKDLSTDNASYPFVKYLVDQGVTKGYPDGTFKPNGKMTRAEMAVMLVKAAGLPINTKPVPKASFKDVAARYWASPYIEASAKAGLIKGYNGYFRPETAVSRAEASTMILRLTSAAKPAANVPAAVKDVKPNYWAAQDIAIALDAGIFTLADKNQFKPEAPAQRLDIARGLALMLNLAPEKSIIAMAGQLNPLEGDVYLNNKKINAITDCPTGSKVETAAGAKAEVKFLDGSSLLLEQNSEIAIKEAKAQTTILIDGARGQMVDYLEISIPKGKIYGGLAATINREEIGEKIGLLPFTRLAALNLPQLAANQQIQAWYKNPYQKKVRVQVDMPWGVAAIRGTFWSNEVTSAGQSTSVANGSVEVSAGGQTVTVPAGQATTVISATAPPVPPAPMPAAEQKAWQEQITWVEQTVTQMQQAAPAIAPPQPVEQQGTPPVNNNQTQPATQPSVTNVVKSVMDSIKQATGASTTAPTSTTSSSHESSSYQTIEVQTVTASDTSISFSLNTSVSSVSMDYTSCWTPVLNLTDGRAVKVAVSENNSNAFYGASLEGVQLNNGVVRITTLWVNPSAQYVVKIYTGTASSPGILAASQPFSYTQSGWTYSGLWHELYNDNSIRNAAIDPVNNGVGLVDLPAGDSSNGLLPSAPSGKCFWFGSSANPQARAVGNYIGEMGSATTFPGGWSNTPQTGYLLSPAITVPTNSPVLKFKSWWEIEGRLADSRDIMSVVIVDVNGEKTLAVLNPEYAVRDTASMHEKAYTSGGYDLPGAWQDYLIPLEGFEGSSIRVKFVFNTKDTGNNGFRGWLIDGFAVTSMTDQSAAIVNMAADISAGSALQVDITGAKKMDGTMLSTPVRVWVSEGSDSLWEGQVNFVNGTGKLYVPRNKINTVGSHTLALYISEVTSAKVTYSNHTVNAKPRAVLVVPDVVNNVTNTVLPHALLFDPYTPANVIAGTVNYYQASPDGLQRTSLGTATANGYVVPNSPQVSDPNQVWSIEAEYAGDGAYGFSKGQGWYYPSSIPKPGSVNIFAVPETSSNLIKLGAVVTGPNGNPVSNLTVEFWVDKNQNGRMEVNEVFTVANTKTDAKGMLCTDYDISGLGDGVYLVHAAANVYGYDIGGEIPLHINRQGNLPPLLAASDCQANVDTTGQKITSVNVKAHFAYEGGSPVSGAVVSVRIDWNKNNDFSDDTTIYGTTDSYGRLSMQNIFAANPGYDWGQYGCQVSCGGISLTTPVWSSNTQTKCVLWAPQVFHHNLTAYLYDDQGNPVSSKTIEFYNSETNGLIGNAATDASGKAELTAADLNAAPYTNDFYYNVKYSAGQDIITITSRYDSSAITGYRQIMSNQIANLKLLTMVLDGTAEPVTGDTVNLYVDTDQDGRLDYNTALLSGSTDASGIYTFNLDYNTNPAAPDLNAGQYFDAVRVGTSDVYGYNYFEKALGNSRLWVNINGNPYSNPITAAVQTNFVGYQTGGKTIHYFIDPTSSGTNLNGFDPSIYDYVNTPAPPSDLVYLGHGLTDANGYVNFPVPEAVLAGKTIADISNAAVLIYFPGDGITDAAKLVRPCYVNAGSIITPASISTDNFPFHPIDQSFGIHVTDTMAAGTGPISVHVTSPSDTVGEDITLSESTTGYFSGSVTLVGSTPSTGQVQVAAGDQVVITYARPGYNPSGWVTATNNIPSADMSGLVVAPEGITFLPSTYSYTVNVAAADKMVIIPTMSANSGVWVCDTNGMGHVVTSGDTLTVDAAGTQPISILYMENMNSPRVYSLTINRTPGQTAAALTVVTNYSAPVAGSTTGTTQIGTLNLAGATKWCYIKQDGALSTPPGLNSRLDGTVPYTVNSDIPVTAGQHIILLATDDYGFIKGYVDLTIASGEIKS
ncbi:MAG: S-layer homology domain-containing protein [Methylocystaceae bacterium]